LQRLDLAFGEIDRLLLNASLVAAIRAGSASTPPLLAVTDPVESSRNNRFAVAVYALSWVNVNAITTNGTITKPCNTHNLCNRTIRNNASNGDDSPTDTSGGPANGGAPPALGRRSRRSRSRFCCSRRGRGDDWAGILSSPLSGGGRASGTAP
jgi:hypothetical protein